MDWNHSQVLMWGQYKVVRDSHTLVANDFITNNPDTMASLLPWRQAYHKLLAHEAARQGSSTIVESPNSVKLTQATPSKVVKFAPTVPETSRRSARPSRGGKGSKRHVAFFMPFI